MIETLGAAYLIVGAMVALFIWWTVFQPDYDEFVEEYFRETPPSTETKWVAIVAAVFIWPYSLWKMFT